MAGGVLFGPAAWDPVAITAQIVAIQCLYYLSLGTLYKMVVGPYVPQLTLHQFFDWRWVSFGSFQGWMVCIACFVNALVAALYLRLIVQRAKKCLDFAGTILFLHLVAVSAYSGFPRHAAWWVLHGTNLAATALLGEWLCMQKEMQEIPLTSLRRSAAAVAAGGGGGGGSGGGSNGGLSRAVNARSSAANVMELAQVVVQPSRQGSLHAQSSINWGPLSPVK